MTTDSSTSPSDDEREAQFDEETARIIDLCTLVADEHDV